MKWVYRIVIGLIVLGLLVAAALWYLAQSEAPEQITYGASFNTFYATDLGLDWKQVYDAMLDDLHVRYVRLAAHWPMVEPIERVYNFAELDYQIERAEEVGAEVILAVGRRLPRWPECHIPRWARDKTWEEQQAAILRYTEKVVERYKDSEAIRYWQVENEPYLEVFAYEHCGDFDEAFFTSQVANMRRLDDSRPLLITDSGNLGLWKEPYKRGDAFGTSVYVYFWNPDIGQFTTITPAWFYRVKERILELMYGDKETMLIELAAEPWLIEPIPDVPIDVQLTRMDLEKFQTIVTYANDTHFEKQYLWGIEWWYWMRDREHPELWEYAKTLYAD